MWENEDDCWSIHETTDEVIAREKREKDREAVKKMMEKEDIMATLDDLLVKEGLDKPGTETATELLNILDQIELLEVPSAEEQKALSMLEKLELKRQQVQAVLDDIQAPKKEQLKALNEKVSTLKNDLANDPDFKKMGRISTRVNKKIIIDETALPKKYFVQVVDKKTVEAEVKATDYTKLPKGVSVETIKTIVVGKKKSE